MKTERLEEGWVKFQRFYCKEGFLDRWMGDQINNPNNCNVPMSNLQLNSFSTYWRCNNGLWINDRELGRSYVFAMLQFAEEFTAQEIWDELLRIEASKQLTP